MDIHERTWTGKFSKKEKMFLMLFAKTGDKLLAVRSAGYGESVEAFMGDRILKRPEAQEELRLLKGDVARSDDANISIEEVVDGFRVIANANITDFFDWQGEVVDVTEMDKVKARAIKEIKRTVNPRNGLVTVTVTMHDKVSALQNLGKIGGHYAADNGQQTGDVNISIALPGGIGGL